MAPTTDLKPWQAEGEHKRDAVRAMFAEIAPTYDIANSVMSASGHHRWRQKAVAAVAISDRDTVLDLCCGTGDFLTAARKVAPQAKLVGIDFCAPMIDVAQQKVDDSTRLAIGDATDLPFADGSFSAITVGWGLRNVPNLNQALSEAARVLKPGGRFVCLDMARPRGPLGPFSNWMYRMLVPLLGKILGKPDAYAYLPKSTEKFVSREELKSAMEDAGFRDIRIRDFYFGNIAMHWGTKQ